MNGIIIFFLFAFAGIINSKGKLWKDQRRFLHDKLRKFGIGMGSRKDQIETRIMVSEYLLNQSLVD